MSAATQPAGEPAEEPAAQSGPPADRSQVPAVLRARLVELAADVLGAMEPLEVPVPLRAVARFAPRKRASAGAGPLWTALQDDPFRARVAREWAARGTEETSDLDRAVGSWLRQTEGWASLVAPPADPAPTGAGDDAMRALTQELGRARTDVEEARRAERSARDDLAAQHRELRRLRSDADRARSEGRKSAEAGRAALDEAQRALAAAQEERQAAADDRREAEAVRTAARAEVRVARRLAEARVRLLLDTIVDAASGLRAELALAPATQRPADLVAPEPERPVPQRQGSRGRALDDPALLDEVLRQPWAHLVVDGYNVSKTGFGALALDEQRRRLVDGLAVVAARTGAEVTCCFDGQESTLPPGGYARGVRVRFSVGEIADDLIRRLVRAEPVGRVLVVATSDQSVARDVEATGAWVVPAATLVARLNRV